MDFNVYDWTFIHSTVACLQSLVKDFNAIIDNKLLIIINEIRDHDGNQKSKDLNDKLKILITDRRIEMEKKLEDKINISSYTRFIGFTNHDIMVYLTEFNRRIQIYEVSNKYIGNKDYFKSLSSYLTQENADIFYTYLLNRTNNVDIRNLINNDLMEANTFKDSVDSFLEELKYSTYVIKEPNQFFNYKQGDNILYAIKKDDLYDIYKLYTNDRGYGQNNKSYNMFF